MIARSMSLTRACQGDTRIRGKWQRRDLHHTKKKKHLKETLPTSPPTMEPDLKLGVALGMAWTPTNLSEAPAGICWADLPKPQDAA
jgi:hypothetical protein